MRNARLDEAQAGVKIARKNINSLYTDDTDDIYIQMIQMIAL